MPRLPFSYAGGRFHYVTQHIFMHHQSRMIGCALDRVVRLVKTRKAYTKLDKANALSASLVTAKYVTYHMKKAQTFLSLTMRTAVARIRRRSDVLSNMELRFSRTVAFHKHICMRMVIVTTTLDRSHIFIECTYYKCRQ